MLCKKCMGIAGWIFLIVGILFLLVDWGVWSFWNIKWWSALFIIFGIAHLAKRNCPACNTLAKKKKR